jgi:long-chain fatty acid transport protein
MGLRTALAALFTLAVAGALPAPALAGGFEYQGQNAPALGRGGAYAAGVDDPMALLTNPAQLSAVPGMQLAAGANLGFYNSCFARTGSYPMDAGHSAAGMDFPEVCNSASPFPAPYIAFAFQPVDRLGIGIGILPPAGIANVRYGRSDGTVMGPDGDRIPAPSRYLLMERDSPLFFPTIGLSYEILPWLRIGGAFGSGIALTSFGTAISALGADDPNQDILSEASGADYFVPRVSASVNMTPHDNLDIMVGFMWTRDIQSDVDLNLTYDGTDETLAIAFPDGIDETIEGATLRTPQPWQLSFGIRYADRIRSRDTQSTGGRLLDGRVNDRMTNERWDIELNVVYERNSNVDAVRVIMPRDENGNLPRLGTGPLATDVDDVVLPHQWRDQIAVRLGGDYNIVPGVFAIRAGFSFESNGVTTGFEQLSFRPARRLGLHAGLTARIAHRVDVILAYAHLFDQTVTLNDIEGDPNEAMVEPETGLGDATFRSNLGRFSSGYNVVSLGLNAYF